MKFRKDINGLRAFAVIAVVLFHFKASWMPGGFAGVDVFFVISGFLMTGIIFKGLENNNFSVLNFYVARANRIIPALAALCLVLLVFGWFYLTPLEYKALGKHAASSIGFLSNVIYWREAGYFDAASHEKWLLHTWSLSVEWQFYIIYPLVLLALKRIFSLKILKSLVIVATVIGFIFSVYATYKWPNASYYLFPMRAWEMMLGGVAFLYPLKLQESNKRLVEILGLILIVGSYIFITGDDPWPGYLALFPVLGTFLVIQAQRNESIITGNIIFQKLGAWSYSIYLWHWPLVVFFYYQYDHNLIGIPLSIILGYLSYKLIERKGASLAQRATGTVIIFVPFAIFLSFSSPNFRLAQQLDSESEAFMYDFSNPECNFRPYNSETRRQEEHLTIAKHCYVPSSTKPTILIHGDSHAINYLPGLKKHFNNKAEILQITGFSCRINDQKGESCKASNELFKNKVQSISPDVVIISMRNEYENVEWDLYLKNLEGLRNVIILGPSPEISIKSLIYKHRVETINMHYINDIDKQLSSYFMRSKFSNIQYISTKDLLCNNDSQCTAVINGQSIYADKGHFSRFGSNYMVQQLIAKKILEVD